MRQHFIIIMLSVAIQLPAKAAVCTDSLTPQALLDLKKMHFDIQSARMQSTDPIYLSALEGTFAAKVTEMTRRHQVSRDQIVSFLLSEEEKISKDQEPIDTRTIPEKDLKLIKQAVGLTRKYGGFTNAFTSVIKKEESYIDESSMQAFLLLLKNAKKFKIAIDINERITSEPERNAKITLLHLAVGHDLPADAIQALLDAGAEIDSQDNVRRTPLEYAVQNKNASLTSLLLKNGADPDMERLGRSTVLHSAAFLNYVEIARILLESGADVNPKSNYSSSPLFSAVLNGHVEMVRLLLSWGADPTIEADLLDFADTKQIQELLAHAILDWKEKKGLQ